MGIVEALLQTPDPIELVELIVIGIALSVDSFATAAAIGVRKDGLNVRQTLRLCGGFGLFHFINILIGFFLGFTVIAFIEGVDHWIAFILLFFVGAKFIYEAFKADGDGAIASKTDPTRGMVLISLCVATSIDALAMGGAFAAMHVGVVIAALIVSLCVVVISYVGSESHHFVNEGFSKYASIIGGLVLIGLGFKVLFDHLVF